MLPSKEGQLYAPVKNLFPRKRFLVRREVPFSRRRIDVVFKDRANGREMTAVELKINHWKRAVWQAVHNRQVATYSFIALPEQACRKVDRGVLKSLGLGLIAVNAPKAKILLEAGKSVFVNEKLAKQIAQRIER